MKKLGRKAVGTKHVFKIKDEPTGLRYKDRVVMKGYESIPGVDYTEKFSPVMTDTSVQIMIMMYLYKLTRYPQQHWVLW